MMIDFRIRWFLRFFVLIFAFNISSFQKQYQQAVAIDTSTQSNSRLVVHLSSKTPTPLKYITFCLGCDSPDSEGSIITGLNPKYGIQEYSVTGELIYCVPNYAESQDIYNAHHLYQKIVLVDRGEVSFFDKVFKIQQQTQAQAVIIADNGDCDDNFQHCQSSRMGGVKEGGFAAHDDESYWQKIHLPVVLISQRTAEKIRKLMKIQKQYIPGLGYHNVSVDSFALSKSLNSFSPPPPPKSGVGDPTAQHTFIRGRENNKLSAKRINNDDDRNEPRGPADGLNSQREGKGNGLSPSNNGNLFQQESLERMAGGSSMNNPFVPPSLPPSEREEIDMSYIEDLQAIDDYHNQLFAESGEDEFDQRHYHHRHLLHGQHQHHQQQRRNQQVNFPFDEL